MRVGAQRHAGAGTGAEQAEAVGDAAATQTFHRHAHFQLLWKGHAVEIDAAGFRHQADDGRGGGIEQSGLDEVAVHGSVEIAVIDHVVDVAENVVVMPSRIDGDEMTEGAAGQGRFAVGIDGESCHGAFSLTAAHKTRLHS